MPPDNNPKPSASTLMSILDKAKYALPGFGLPMAVRDIVSRISLNRMSENLDPYNYANYGTNKSAAERYIGAVVGNKKEEARKETEQYLEKGYGMKPSPQFKERVDLLQMLAGKKQKYNTIEPSQYRPRVGAEKGAQYYSSKGIEDAIIEELGLNDKNIKWQKQLADIAEEKALLDEKGRKMIGKGGAVAIIPGLGGATYGVGRDEKGTYLSYGDVWDLDPSKGVFSDPKKAVDFTSIEGLKNLAEATGKSAFSNIVNAMATPPKVYGRIYFDPKTGKPIR